MPKFFLFSNILTSSTVSVCKNFDKWSSKCPGKYFFYWLFFSQVKISCFCIKCSKFHYMPGIILVKIFSYTSRFYQIFLYGIALKSILFLKTILNNVPIAYYLNFINVIVRKVTNIWVLLQCWLQHFEHSYCFSAGSVSHK